MPILGEEKPVTPPTYTIYQHGPNYYADPSIESGKTRLSGTVAQSVIQAALNNLTAGRTWKEKVVLKGNITISDTVKVPSYTILQIEGKLSLASGTNKNMIENSDPTNGNTAIEVCGGLLDGNKANQASGHGIKFVKVRWKSSIINVIVQNFKEDGMNLDNYKYAHISQVFCSDNEGNGIYVFEGANILFNVHNQGNGGAGIRLAYGGHMVVTLSYLTHNGYGMLIGESDDNSISADMSANTYDGVNIFSNADNNIIHGSSIRENSRYGVNIVDNTCDRTQVKNNVILENVVGELVNSGTNSLIKSNIGYVTENSGIVYFNGDGATVTFNIPHGLAATPTYINALKYTNIAQDIEYAAVVGANIAVTFEAAPPVGVNNVGISWEAKA